MSAIQAIFQQFAPAYLATHRERIPREHLRVIDAILQCRTGEPVWCAGSSTPLSRSGFGPETRHEEEA